MFRMTRIFLIAWQNYVCALCNRCVNSFLSKMSLYYSYVICKRKTGIKYRGKYEKGSEYMILKCSEGHVFGNDTHSSKLHAG